jgi:hypothetical protein
MATERLSMRRTREILRQKLELGRSHREVAASVGLSVGAVSATLVRAAAAGLSWASVQGLSDEALDERLYGAKSGAGRPLPDCAYLHLERKKPGVTLELLHLEYLEKHRDGYRYTQFCERYREWLSDAASLCAKSTSPARSCTSTTLARSRTPGSSPKRGSAHDKHSTQWLYGRRNACIGSSASCNRTYGKEKGVVGTVLFLVIAAADPDVVTLPATKTPASSWSREGAFNVKWGMGPRDVRAIYSDMDLDQSKELIRCPVRNHSATTKIENMPVTVGFSFYKGRLLKSRSTVHRQSPSSSRRSGAGGTHQYSVR